MDTLRKLLSQAMDAADPGLLKQIVFSGPGIDADLCNQHLNGWPPLVMAALDGKVAHVRLLIQAGADINATQEFTGDDALSLAANCGHLDVVSALIDSGADPNRTLDQHSFFGEKVIPVTPFFRAVESAPIHIVSYLARKGGRLQEDQVQLLIRHSPKRACAIEHVLSVAMASELLELAC